MISQFFPDPEQDYKLNPQDPADQDTIEKLRVHIDAIKPVWRKDVARVVRRPRARTSRS